MEQNTTNEIITLENFAEMTGRKRFHMTAEQKSRGISREEALQEWVAAGGMDQKPKKYETLDDSIFQDERFTLENFTSLIEELTGQAGRRFRVSPDQRDRITAGDLTREEAFAEFLAAKRQTNEVTV